MKLMKVLLATVVMSLPGGLLADSLQEARQMVARVINLLPEDDRDEDGILDSGISFATNAEYRSLAVVVSNDWRNVLANINMCATNQLERLLILGVRDQFDVGFYLDFLDTAVNMKTNNVISSRELEWVRRTNHPEMERYLVRHYSDLRVREVVLHLQVAEPSRMLWGRILSGEAYTNYLDQVEVGMWGDNPPR